MANVQNSFIKSKLNKDLDARLLPNGEYRDARNVQVSRSEGPNVGSLENVLGNKEIINFNNLTGSDETVCIGYVVNEATDEMYLFLTEYTDPQPSNLTYSINNESFIVVYDTKQPASTAFNSPNPRILVQGAFLNFSTTHEIYHVNLLENLLFWTDNRNQPRVINVDFAKEKGVTYYTTEDSISVAKYNPYEPITFWQESALGGANSYETTMKDVTSKVLPNGGSGLVNNTGGYSAGQTQINLKSVTGDLATVLASSVAGGTYAGDNYGGATVGVVNTTTQVITTVANALLSSVTYQPNPPSGIPNWQVTITGGTFPALNEDQEIVFNFNPYYDANFAGDANFLEDKFVRFSYRYKFIDNEYSIMAPFTQIAFIPKQDGYFMYQKAGDGIQRIDNQAEAYQSTIVSFVENKVDEIKLNIPLPFSKTVLENAVTSPLKIKELEILYKESDGLAVKIVDTIPLADLVSDKTTVDFIYDYLSKKPVKVLPSADITRVYDKIPVRAFAQEVAGNRVIYGNFQNKHTPPEFLNYNVGVGTKFDFSLENGTLTVTNAATYSANNPIAITTGTGVIQVGSFVSTSTAGNTIPANTQITEITGTPPAITSMKLSNNVTLTAGVVLTVTPFGEETQKVSKIEYPNSTLKQNRTYQVGVVLSDRYGRTSSVILSNNKNLVQTSQGSFIGDTIYSSYLGPAIQPNNWPGNAIKMLFNSIISSNKNIGLGVPGLYNGNSASAEYNPLGWYTYKIVVKQTEQEYYNVYLPGIMASYPEDTSLEINRTSHAVLINDNINKIPRDLNEVGPDQKQFRSSVQLFGRVENTNLTVPTTYDTDNNLQNSGVINDQYFTGRNSDTVSTISTVQDLFDYNPLDPPSPNFFGAFYQVDSNPLVAKISTTKKIGQISSLNYRVASALVFQDVNPSTNPYKILLKNVNGTNPSPGDIIVGPNLDENTTVLSFTTVSGQAYDAELTVTVAEVTPFTASKPTLAINDRLDFFPGFDTPRATEKTPGIQYLAVYETEPVESALDIFWETTTVGEIDKLNNLILNATQSAGGISAINTSNWNEGIPNNTNILDADFTLVDSFGSNINPANITSVTLDSVFNSVQPPAGPVNVQTSDSSGPYFELVAGGSSGFFNIKTKTPYYNNIFFSNDADIRVFSFNLSATTVDNAGDSTTNQLQIANVGPQNVAPVLLATFKTNGSTPADVPYSPASAINGATIESSRFVSPVARFNGHNGANNTTLRVQDFDWSIISVKDTLSSTPNANIISQNYFVMTNFNDGAGATTPNSRRGDLTIQLSSIPPSNNPIPASKFDIQVVGRDAAGSSQEINLSFFLDLRIIPSTINEVEAFYDPNDQDGPETGFFVEMQITTGTIAQNGWYIFPQRSSLAVLANASITGGTIAIDESERVTTQNANSWGNALPTKTFFVNNTTASGQTACRELFRTSTFWEHAASGTTYTATVAPNQGNYTYEFIP